MDKTRTLISGRNRNLAKLAALRAIQEEIFGRPVPVHIDGQLSLFDADQWVNPVDRARAAYSNLKPNDPRRYTAV